MTALVRFMETDAARSVEEARLMPLGAARAVLEWPLPPPENEDTVLPDVVALLSRALTACGPVAFRYDGILSGADFTVPPRRSSPIQLLDAIGRGDVFGFAITSDPALVGELFAYGGWSYSAQLALVHDPSADRAPILEALRGGMDWRHRRLPDGVRLLFGPGHDGDTAVVATEDRNWLRRFEEALG